MIFITVSFPFLKKANYLVPLASSWLNDQFFFLPVFSLFIGCNSFKLCPCVCFCGKREHSEEWCSADRVLPLHVESQLQHHEAGVGLRQQLND